MALPPQMVESAMGAGGPGMTMEEQMTEVQVPMDQQEMLPPGIEIVGEEQMIEVEAEERRGEPQACRRQCRLAARMAAPHDDHVEGFGGGGGHRWAWRECRRDPEYGGRRERTLSSAASAR